MEKEHIGFEIRTLSNLLQRKINQMVADEEDTLTVHQVWVLKFLVSRGEKETVQRDIEEKFSIRRSTASHMQKASGSPGCQDEADRGHGERHRGP